MPWSTAGRLFPHTSQTMFTKVLSILSGFVIGQGGHSHQSDTVTVNNPPRPDRPRLTYAEKAERHAAKMAKKSPEQVEAYAYNLAIWHLAQRPLTRKQLAEKLEKKLVPPAVAEVTMDRLTELHALDDEDYARSFARTAMTSRGLSRSATMRELQRRGVEAEIAELAVDAVDEERGDTGEWDAALRLAERKAKASRSVADPVKRRRRVINAVVSKGYGFEIAARAADHAIATLDT